MSTVTVQLNRGIAKVPFYHRVRHWLYVGRAGLLVSPGDDGRVATRIALERVAGHEPDYPAGRIGREVQLVCRESGRLREAVSKIEEPLRIGSVRVMPRALLIIDGSAVAVQLELQAINPRGLVHRAHAAVAA